MAHDIIRTREPVTVQLGRNHFTITSAEWNNTMQLGEIDFVDQDGNKYSCLSLGMMRNEISLAVMDYIVDELIDRKTGEFK